MSMKTIRTLNTEHTSHFGKASHQNTPGQYESENKLLGIRKHRNVECKQPRQTKKSMNQQVKHLENRSDKFWCIPETG